LVVALARMELGVDQRPGGLLIEDHLQGLPHAAELPPVLVFLRESLTTLVRVVDHTHPTVDVATEVIPSESESELRVHIDVLGIFDEALEVDLTLHGIQAIASEEIVQQRAADSLTVLEAREVASIDSDERREITTAHQLELFLGHVHAGLEEPVGYEQH